MSETRTKNWGAKGVEKTVLETSWIEEVSGTLFQRANRLKRVWQMAAIVVFVAAAVAAVLAWLGMGHEPLRSIGSPDIPKALAKALEASGPAETSGAVDGIRTGMNSFSTFVTLSNLVKVVGVLSATALAISGLIFGQFARVFMGLMLIPASFVFQNVIEGIAPQHDGLESSLFSSSSERAEHRQSKSDARQKQIEEAISFGLPARVTELIGNASADAQEFGPYLVAQAQLKQKDSEINWDAYRANLDLALERASNATPELQYSADVLAMMENKAWGMSRSLRSFNHEQQEAEAKSRLNLWANLVLAVCGLMALLSGFVFALEQYMRKNLKTIYRLSGVSANT
ncbi:hypothetical protein [Comamonas testosteroni]|uniref:Transmembrane protein n=2 Tax=Comamonas testosteroni TaxID=285 RepID=A0A096FLJ9_COMTE|nr:hypothetical protein [Comamonas testosteroni]KGH30789.1 hypothetical protein P353_07985 [Comamonas testosteroni]WKL18890.1 hypothetical protein QYQ99_28230 [Comamonas testosteroni]